MASWLLKAGVQGAVSVLPGHPRINAVLQRRVTGRGRLTDELFEAKLTHANRHLRRYARVTGRKRPPDAILELGTGRHPVVPVALALCGVPRVVSFDVQPLAPDAQVRETIERFLAYRRSGRLVQRLPRARAERLDRLDAETGLAPLGVELRVGQRPAALGPCAPFELVVSNNTLEHIPPDVLRESMGDVYGLVVADGVMDHFIDMRDHYADFDKKLNRLNFLRYPDPVWRPFNNRLQYLNRLRLTEYRRIFAEAGFEVREERVTQGRPGEFDDLRLARRFRAMPREEVLALFAWMTAAKAPRDARPRPSPGRTA